MCGRIQSLLRQRGLPGRRRTRQSWRQSNAGLLAWCQDWKTRVTKRSYWSWTYLPWRKGDSMQIWFKLSRLWWKLIEWTTKHGFSWQQMEGERTEVQTAHLTWGRRQPRWRLEGTFSPSESLTIGTCEVKNARTVTSFKRSFKNHRKSLVPTT